MKKLPNIQDTNDLEVKQRSRAKPDGYFTKRRRPSKPETDKILYWRLPPEGVKIAKGECYCHNCKEALPVGEFDSPNFVYCKACYEVRGCLVTDKDSVEELKL